MPHANGEEIAPNDERQHEQDPGQSSLRVTCTFKRSPHVASV